MDGSGGPVGRSSRGWLKLNLLEMLAMKAHLTYVPETELYKLARTENFVTTLANKPNTKKHKHLMGGGRGIHYC